MNMNSSELKPSPQQKGQLVLGGQEVTTKDRSEQTSESPKRIMKRFRRRVEETAQRGEL